MRRLAYWLVVLLAAVIGAHIALAFVQTGHKLRRVSIPRYKPHVERPADLQPHPSLIDGLRQLADFLEENPLDGSTVGCHINFFYDTPEGYAKGQSQMGGTLGDGYTARHFGQYVCVHLNSP